MAEKSQVRLTDARIRAAQWTAEGPNKLSDHVVQCLHVRIHKTKKSFVVHKRVAKKPTTITLDCYHPQHFTLAQARRQAQQIIADIEAGDAPSVSAAKGFGSRATIADLAPAYYKAKSRLRTIDETRRIFKRHIIPNLGQRMADAVTRADVTAFLDKIASPSMARATAAQLSAFYSWALPRLPSLTHNPVKGAGKPRAPVARDRVLSRDELRAVLAALADQTPAFRDAIGLMLLTLQRRSEVFEARWEEFDLDGAVWTIPKERTKNGVRHIVPLSDQASALLAAIGPKERGLVFQSRSSDRRAPSGFSKVWKRIREKVEESAGHEVERFTMHDLRRTGATNMQRLGVRLEVVEEVLNHVGSRSGLVGVYQRHPFEEEKRGALQVWADEIEKVSGETGNNQPLA